MADHFWPVGAANREIQSLVLQTCRPLDATGGTASAWRRRRRRLTLLSLLALPLGFAYSYQRRAGGERGGDADMTDGEKGANADEGRATDGQR